MILVILQDFARKSNLGQRLKANCMGLPDWTKLALSDGVLSERIPDGNRIVLWVPEDREGGMDTWERIASIAGAEIKEKEGICSLAATQSRPRVQGQLHRRDGERSVPTPKLRFESEFPSFHYIARQRVMQIALVFVDSSARALCHPSSRPNAPTAPTPSP